MERVRLGVMSDLHVAEPGTPDTRWINPVVLGVSAWLVDTALGQLADQGLHALVLLGDLTQDGTPAQLDLIQRLLGPVTAPRLAVPGNHDLRCTADPLPGAGLAQPARRARIGPLQVAAGQLSRRADGRFREDAPPDPSGRRPGEPLLWLSHFPVLDAGPVLHAVGLPHAGDLANRADVAEALHRHDGPVIVLTGHLHVHYSLAEDDVLQLGHPALAEVPHGYGVVEVSVAEGSIELLWHTSTLQPGTDAPVDALLAGRWERWRWRPGGWRRTGSRSDISSSPQESS